MSISATNLFAETNQVICQHISSLFQLLHFYGLIFHIVGDFGRKGLESKLEESMLKVVIRGGKKGKNR